MPDLTNPDKPQKRNQLFKKTLAIFSNPILQLYNGAFRETCRYIRAINSCFSIYKQLITCYCQHAYKHTYSF